MVYSFLLNQHANIRYREAVGRLGQAELEFMLKGLGFHSAVRLETLGGANFLTFECEPLSPDQMRLLARHSSAVFFAERIGETLKPLNRPDPDRFPADLPEVLKYKGKTSPAFTKMMMNIALSLTPFMADKEPCTVFDPLCGKATTAFCAIEWGMNAVGLDLDRKDLREASDYFERCLKIHLLKHTVDKGSLTVGKRSVPETRFTVARDKEEMKTGDVRTLQLLEGDTALADALMKKHPAHILVADLPYGIQHAPQAGQHPESFGALLNRAMPSWFRALKPGGAVALSFNTLTVPTPTVIHSLENAGFSCVATPCLRHEVEQAVVRDAVFAVKPV